MEQKLKRLTYRSKYRGTKELDMFFGPFAEKHLKNFTEQELDEYEKILETHEPVLFDWITGKQKPPEEFSGPVMKKILNYSIDQ